MSENVVYSHCHYCVSLCGTKITVENNRIKSIEPDRENPLTWKDFCRKGKTAGELVEHPQRIRTPMKRVGSRYVEATYEEAIADIASRLNEVLDKHGADAVATYTGNPLAFDFGGSLFFNGLQDAMGSGNRYWVGSIDQNNTHVVQDEMFGSELLSLPADIDECDFFLMLGMDPVQSKFGWLETNPDGWNRVLKRQRQGAQVVVVDPRYSETAKCADTYVPIQPGADWAFVLGLLHVIFSEKMTRPSQIPLRNIEPVRDIALQVSLCDMSERCGVSTATMQDVAKRFARAERAMALSHTGISHSGNGTIGEWLVTVLNAVTNRLDTPGGRKLESSYLDVVKIFSAFAPPSTHLTRLKRNPAIAGYHSLAELPDEITTPGQGQIKAMMIVSGNPVVSGPDSVALDKALESLDCLVVVDMIQRKSHRHADWLIPGTHFLEREGLNCLFAGFFDQPYAQYANKAVDRPDTVWPEWKFFLELTLAMKRPFLGKPGVNSFIKVTQMLARLTGNENLTLNPAWIERLLVASGKRIKYKEIKNRPHGWIFGEKRYGDLAKVLRTPDKKVHVSPPRLVEALQEALAQKQRNTSDAYPMLMINKRSRESMNSWLNELPGMFQNSRSNDLDIQRDDAESLGVVQGQQVRISSKTGSVMAPVNIVDGGLSGVVCLAHGWGSTIYDPATGAVAQEYGVNRNELVDRHKIDRISQTPNLSAVPVRLELVAQDTASQISVAAEA